MIRGRGLHNQRGVALVTVALMTVLVVGLVALALTNVMVGSLVANNAVVTQNNKECGHGDLDLSEEFVRVLADEGLQKFGASSGKMIEKGDIAVEATILQEMADGEEISSKAGTTTGTSTVVLDDMINDPDIQITAEKNSKKPGGDCATRIDIDKLYQAKLSGGNEAGVNTGYHTAHKGKGCDDGNLYAIATVTQNMQTNTISRFRSAYYDCTG